MLSAIKIPLPIARIKQNQQFCSSNDKCYEASFTFLDSIVQQTKSKGAKIAIYAGRSWFMNCQIQANKQTYDSKVTPQLTTVKKLTTVYIHDGNKMMAENLVTR